MEFNGLDSSCGIALEQEKNLPACYHLHVDLWICVDIQYLCSVAVPRWAETLTCNPFAEM